MAQRLFLEGRGSLLGCILQLISHCPALTLLWGDALRACNARGALEESGLAAV